MPKTTAVDMHALLDLVDAELRARRSPAALVSGLVPEDHSRPDASLPGADAPRSSAGFEASSLPVPSADAGLPTAAAVAVLSVSSSPGLPRCGIAGDFAPDARPARSRSPKSGTLSEPAGGPCVAPSQLLEAFLNSQSTGGDAVAIEPPRVEQPGVVVASSRSSSLVVDASWRSLGLYVRPQGDGYELAGEGASPGSPGPRRRSVFVPAFESNRVLSGAAIVRHCELRHRAGHAWSAVEELCLALRRVAEVEQSRGPAGALALLRSGQ